MSLFWKIRNKTERKHLENVIESIDKKPVCANMEFTFAMTWIVSERINQLASEEKDGDATQRQKGIVEDCFVKNPKRGTSVLLYRRKDEEESLTVPICI